MRWKFHTSRRPRRARSDFAVARTCRFVELILLPASAFCKARALAVVMPPRLARRSLVEGATADLLLPVLHVRDLSWLPRAAGAALAAVLHRRCKVGENRLFIDVITTYRHQPRPPDYLPWITPPRRYDVVVQLWLHPAGFISGVLTMAGRQPDARQYLPTRQRILVNRCLCIRAWPLYFSTIYGYIDMKSILMLAQRFSLVLTPLFAAGREGVFLDHPRQAQHRRNIFPAKARQNGFSAFAAPTNGTAFLTRFRAPRIIHHAMLQVIYDRRHYTWKSAASTFCLFVHNGRWTFHLRLPEYVCGHYGSVTANAEAVIWPNIF